MVRDHGRHRHLLRAGAHHEGSLAASACQGAQRLCRHTGLPAARSRAALQPHPGEREGTGRQARPAHRRDPERGRLFVQGNRRAESRRRRGTAIGMFHAFALAIGDLGDRRLRGVVWQSLLLSLLLQAALVGFAWWAVHSYANFQWDWVNRVAHWVGDGAMVVLALLLFPASFGIVISIFMERIADIVESKHYPQLGKARGISIWTGLWTGLVFLVAVIVLNLVMLPFYLVALFVAGLGALIFYGLNGWLTA